MRENPQHYELAWILSGTLADEECKPINDQLIALLKEKDATNLTSLLALGKKKLAYPIGAHRHGSYYALEFDLLPKLLPTLQRALKLNQQLIRFLIIVKPKLSAEDLARQELSRQKRAKTKEIEKIVRETPKPKETAKISLEDLDKKLDEILNDDNLNL